MTNRGQKAASDISRTPWRDIHELGGGGLPQVLIGLKLASELIETEAISGANSIRVAQTGAGTQAASVGVALHLQPAIRTMSVLLCTRVRVGGAEVNINQHSG